MEVNIFKSSEFFLASVFSLFHWGEEFYTLIYICPGVGVKFPFANVPEAIMQEALVSEQTEVNEDATFWKVARLRHNPRTAAYELSYYTNRDWDFLMRYDEIAYVMKTIQDHTDAVTQTYALREVKEKVLFCRSHRIPYMYSVSSLTGAIEEHHMKI